jgi:hypothetical protein
MERLTMPLKPGFIPLDLENYIQVNIDGCTKLRDNWKKDDVHWHYYDGAIKALQFMQRIYFTKKEQ